MNNILNLKQRGILEVGKYSYYDSASFDIRYFDEGNRVKIGNFTSIAAGVTIVMGGYHRINTISQYPFGKTWPSQIKIDGKFNSYAKGDVIIGSDCYIASNCMIMSGVTIGDGAVICAGSVVTKDVEPYSINGGTPSKLIRYRFSSEIIDKLMKIKWRDFDDSVITEIVKMDLFDSDDFEKFFNFVGEMNV